MTQVNLKLTFPPVEGALARCLLVNAKCLFFFFLALFVVKALGAGTRTSFLSLKCTDLFSGLVQSLLLRYPARTESYRNPRLSPLLSVLAI